MAEAADRPVRSVDKAVGIFAAVGRLHFPGSQQVGVFRVQQFVILLLSEEVRRVLSLLNKSVAIVPSLYA